MDQAERNLLTVRAATEQAAFSTALTMIVAGAGASLLVALAVGWLLARPDRIAASASVRSGSARPTA